MDSDDRILADQENGLIYYDADGDGAAPAILFAKVTPGITIAAANFATY